MTDVAYRFRMRRGTAANLASVNEIPLAGELVIETDTLRQKLGDGTTAYNSLPYVTDSGVASFNGRTGTVVLTSGDVTTALGFTPANKAGDTFTGVVNVTYTTATLAVFENTNSAIARVGFKGNTTTSATTVMFGANGDDAVIYAGGLIRLQLYSTGEVLSRSGALGYASGAGGSVTQATSKATGVTINQPCGQIVTHAAALAASAIVSFTVTNSVIAATDTVTIHRASGGTAASYRVWIDSVAAGSFVVCVQNISAGSLSQAVTLSFAVTKAVAA